ncbi:MAG TPA: class I SAM-dependent methyltransferase [Burkholderiales bacterium]|nr:class I SAM-dependent methyltransferase [Burkholderiales bacterium]
MNTTRYFQWAAAACFAMALAAPSAAQQKPFTPVVGQEGKDVVWVPTPQATVEKMLDVAQVTPQDFVMDLGSGDGRNIIAAAKRGARARGVEYNPDMVELARRAAESEGVADRATFLQGDMYEADISQATVLALFLLPENLDKLAEKFLALNPGTRIVVNQFWIEGWDAEETQRAEGDCGAWCNVLLIIVPARVAGTWRLPSGELRLAQRYQTISGTLSAGGKELPVSGGRLRGDQITFVADGVTYAGRVRGERMDGLGGGWSAIRVSAGE